VVVLKLDRDRLLKSLDSHMESAYLFFKHLSRSSGGRLILVHRQTESANADRYGKCDV